MTKNDHIKTQLAKLPDEPGIYLYYDKNNNLIYVGKATSLKQRVRSYFTGKRTNRPIEQMIDLVETIQYRTADSVLEAIIMEANAIKKFQPKYNVLGKDNKSWNYIVITNDSYPKVQTLRQHDYIQLQKKVDELQGKRGVGKARSDLKQYKYIFGPYPGLNSKAALKLLRQLFDFSTCKPGTGKPCLYRQMNQCLGVCTGDITEVEYRQKVIQPLLSFLRGNKKRLIKRLEKDMQEAAKQEDYEEAARLRDQVQALTKIHDMALLNKSFYEDNIGASVIKRIEGYDISNLGSTGKVGSMVVFDMSGPQKSEYRKFTIKTVEGQSDVDSLKEVLARRLRHTEWQYPDIFLIDGGKPQVNAVQQVMNDFGVTIPVVGIAKGPERKRNDFTFSIPTRPLVKWVKEQELLLTQVRDEAHRFAITFQRQKRKLKK